MTLPLVALVLAAPLLLLAAAVVALAEHGPAGWGAAVAVVVAVALLTRAGCRRCWAWWLSTKAPEKVRDPASLPGHWFVGQDTGGGHRTTGSDR